MVSNSFLTEKDNGSVLNSEDIDTKSGKKIIDVLLSKHPDSGDIHRSCLLDETIPDKEAVMITAGQIEATTRALKGSAGPSGMDAELWHDLLLRRGKQSENLR